MPQFIIHKDGAFNLFCTVVDSCWFEPALTLEGHEAPWTDVHTGVSLAMVRQGIGCK